MAASQTTKMFGSDLLFGRFVETARHLFEGASNEAQPHAKAEMNRVMSDGQLRDIGLDRQALAHAHERPVLVDIF